MDEKEVYKIHDQIEGRVDAIHVGRSLSQLSSGDGIGKCFSCSHAWIMRAARENNPTVRCGAVYETPFVMPHDVAECNRYSKKGEVDIWTLIKMHNPVDLSKPEKVVGFSKDDESTETPSV